MTQRIWLITGVSSGFGRHLAEQLLARGDRVVGTVRKAAAAADLVAAHPDRFRAEILDVTDTAALREVVDRTFADLGRVDVVVSNAGYGLFGAGEEYTDDQIRHIIDTNLVGSIQLIRAALPHLRAQGGGRIIQLSSYGGQVAFYVGIARAFDFLHVTNEVLASRGVTLPLGGQSTTDPDTRHRDGLALQKSIFGDRIDQNYANAPENQWHIQEYLSANCFGDYYTRTGLDVPTRELLTFAVLLSMGGCEPQLRGHIQGNLNVGNDKATLLSVVTQLIPYVGYPRALNALSCLNEVIPEPSS